MSASRERKKRVELEQNAPAIQKPAEKKKISEGVIFAVVMLLIVACMIGFVIGRGIWARNQTVLTVGEHEVSVKEFNYFYNSIANQYLTYASYFGSSYGVTTETALDKTPVTSGHVTFLQMMSMYGYLSLDTSSLRLAADGSYEGTVAELLADNAKTQIISCYVTYDDAVKTGYELEDTCYDEIDAEIEELKAHGKDNYGWNLNKTIRNTFGSGCTKQSYYDYMVLTHTASHYVETLEYSNEEIDARYNENTQEFDVAAFYYYTVSPSDFLEADEEGNMPEATDAEKEKAKVSAEAMEKEFVLDDEEKSVSLKVDYTFDGVKNLCGEDAANWIFGEAAADAVKLFNNEDTYYVLKFLNRDDYDLANVIQIYVPADAEATEEEEHDHEEGEEHEESSEPATPAADKLADIDNTLAAGASVDSFKALAEKYAEEGAEIEVEKLTRSSLLSVSEESCLWAMEAGRAVGDYAKFEVSGGTLYVMITGYGNSFVHASVNQTLASEWLENACAAATEICGYNVKAAMRGNVGLAMSQQDLGV